MSLLDIGRLNIEEGIPQHSNIGKLDDKSGDRVLSVPIKTKEPTAILQVALYIYLL